MRLRKYNEILTMIKGCEVSYFRIFNAFYHTKKIALDFVSYIRLPTGKLILKNCLTQLSNYMFRLSKNI